MVTFCSRSVILSELWSSSDQKLLFTDASCALGFAAVLGENCLLWAGRKSKTWLSDCSQRAVFYCFSTGNLEFALADKKILFITDDMAIVHVINKHFWQHYLITFFWRKSYSRQKLYISRSSFLVKVSPKPHTDRNSQEPFKNLNPTCLKLFKPSLSSTSLKAYRKSWSLLLTWKLNITLLVKVTDVCNFIGHLFLQNYSPATILTHISAIRFIHKLCDITTLHRFLSPN